MHHFHIVLGEHDAQYIVGEPVLFHQIPAARDARDDQTHHVIRCEIVIEEGRLLVAFPRYDRWHLRTNHWTQ